MSKNVALICTSASELKGKPTGAWLEEIATPYYTLLDAGYEVSFVSTKGGQIPIDAASTQGDFYTPDCVKFMADETAVAALSSSAALASHDFSSVAGIYIAGGHGCCVDFYKNPELTKVIDVAFADSKPVAADCHGPVALLSCSKPDGTPLIAGKRVTGFTDTEEAAVGLTEAVPELIEAAFRGLGADFSKAESDWSPHAVADGCLITGQNPASSKACVDLFVAAIAA